jgi:hypothetical protein
MITSFIDAFPHAFGKSGRRLISFLEAKGSMQKKMDQGILIPGYLHACTNIANPGETSLVVPGVAS